MNTFPSDTRFAAASRRALEHMAALWLVLALVGQWAFCAYIAAFYGGSALHGEFEVWNRLQALGPTPYVVGDTRGNFAFLTHALGAGLVALSGGLQLIPAVRQRLPRFHRWNGRLFLVTVVALTCSGFYLEWVRDAPPQHFEDWATSVNGLLILGFAALAYRSARARRFAAHREWALRLFLVSNAQWFTRIGLFAYFGAGRALGIELSAELFFPVWKFGCFLLPLLVAELYLRAPQRSAGFQAATALLLLALSLLMLLGMVVYGAFTWRLWSGAPLLL
jgi:hypothetical protein